MHIDTFVRRIKQVLQDIFTPAWKRPSVWARAAPRAINTDAPAPTQPPPLPDTPGEDDRKPLRIFAAFRHFNWEDYNLQPALEKLGEVIRYNWHPRFNQYDRRWHWGGKQRMNLEFLQTVHRAHQEQPIDIFFGYLSGRVVFPGVIRAIEMMGIPTLNIFLDDERKFYSSLEPTGFAGMVDIASAFTLCWTTTKEAVANYERVGARAIYLPPGANPDVFHPYDLSGDIDVCFVGQKYGRRPQIMAYLRERGINVQTFGRGWDSGEIPMEEMVKLFSRSKITLGIGTVGDSTDVVCIKGRDFEVPMSGGFYLTQYNPDLEEFYEIRTEIVCYDSLDDLVGKIRYYLTHPDEAEEIRQAGLHRARQEHTWVGRFRQAFVAMGIPASKLRRFGRLDCAGHGRRERMWDSTRGRSGQ